MKKDINIAKINRFGLHTPRTCLRLTEQIAQMQVAYKDPKRCPACGSRQVIRTN
jgi:ribosomal protein L37AE/L43A